MTCQADLAVAWRCCDTTRNQHVASGNVRQLGNGRGATGIQKIAHRIRSQTSPAIGRWYSANKAIGSIKLPRRVQVVGGLVGSLIAFLVHRLLYLRFSEKVK